MLKNKIVYLPIGILSSLTLISGLVLSSDGVIADTASRTATVTVSSSCSFSGGADSAKSSSSNVSNTTEVVFPTLKVFCNDSSGYAVYMAGFSNNTLGTTGMIGTYGTIATGTATSGNTSNWAVKITRAGSSNYPTIPTEYQSYAAIPSTYQKVASYPGGTDTAGSSFTPSFRVYVGPAQAAGSYVGKVKFSLVHPSSASAPAS